MLLSIPHRLIQQTICSVVPPATADITAVAEINWTD